MTLNKRFMQKNPNPPKIVRNKCYFNFFYMEKKSPTSSFIRKHTLISTILAFVDSRAQVCRSFLAKGNAGAVCLPFHLAKRNNQKLANIFALVSKRERWSCLPAVPCLNKGNNPKLANFCCTCL